VKILVNCFDLLDASGGAGGAGSYVHSLLPELAKRAEVRVVASPHNVGMLTAAAERGGFQTVPLGQNHIHPISSHLDWADVYFCPLNGLSPSFIDSRIPIICTILDLQHIHYPQFFGEAMTRARHENYGAAIARADAVTTISEYEKHNIRRTYGKQNVHVTYLSGYLADACAAGAVEPELSADLCDAVPWLSEGGFMLFPAIPWRHKNHYRLIQAFHYLNTALKPGQTPKLVLTGAGGHHLAKANFLDLIREHRLAGKVAVLGHVADADLAWLMRNASLLTFPSLYEGFGIPAVDAMKLGLPVITSPVACIPEVCGNAVAYFEDPTDSWLIARDIAELLDDGERLAELTRRGTAQGALFSAQRTAEATLACFQDAIAARADARPPEVVTVSPVALCKPAERITIVLDALSGFHDVESGNAPDHPVLQALSKAAKAIDASKAAIQTVVLVDGRMPQDAVRAMAPRNARLAYGDRCNLGSIVRLLQFVTDEVLSTDFALYARAESFDPNILQEISYAASVLDTVPEMMAVQLSSTQKVLKVRQAETGTELLKKYNACAAQPSDFFHDMLLRGTAVAQYGLCTSLHLHHIMAHGLTLVLPVRKAAAQDAPSDTVPQSDRAAPRRVEERAPAIAS